jgi:NTP pyrophosphatase (non-canonical NTP hydrolase)
MKRRSTDRREPPPTSTGPGRPGQIPLNAEHQAVRKALGRAAVSNILEMALLNNNIGSLSVMQQATVEWANSAFPNRSAGSAFLKMFEELGELVKKPRSAEEYADVLIMLLDLAHMHGLDYEALYRALIAKLEINYQRTWLQTGTGVFQHGGE